MDQRKKLTVKTLNRAARINDVKSVEMHLNSGLKPNCTDKRGWNCLHEAAARDSYQSLLLILKHPDVRPLAETRLNQTALYLACLNKSSISVIEALLKSHPDIVNYSNCLYITPLHVAVNNIEALQMLINYGALIDVQDFQGDTALHNAALQNHRAVSVLLHAGADPEIKNNSDNTPFHFACYQGSFQSVKKLFPFVYDINQVDKSGWSPLMFSAYGQHKRVVEFLLKNGANPNIKDTRGALALNMALNKTTKTVFKMLLTHTDICKVDFNKIEDLNMGPTRIGDYTITYITNAPLNTFMNMCEYIYDQSPNKFREMFYLCLMKGLAVDAANCNECPPIAYIHYVSINNCLREVFEILLEHNCNIDYSSVVHAPQKEQYIPDAFLASVDSEFYTAPLLLSCSLYCDPEYLIKFVQEFGLENDIEKKVQKKLLTLIGVDCDIFKIKDLPYIVKPLQHLCRQRIRCNIRNTKSMITTREYLNIVNRLNIPLPLKNYIRYVKT